MGQKDGSFGWGWEDFLCGSWKGCILRTFERAGSWGIRISWLVGDWWVVGYRYRYGLAMKDYYLAMSVFSGTFLFGRKRVMIKDLYGHGCIICIV
jgi:hypothetical protein